MQPIADWLKKLGMSEYAERFAEERIEIDVLPELTDQDLERLGIPLGHRRRMLRAIRDLGSPSAAATAPSAPAATEPSPHDNAERRQLTVMFTDLVGSTALSTKLDPEDMRFVIGAYHKCVADTVARFDGFVAKYMGDGVLIYFGYPHAHEDDAERAVRTGLALIEAVGKLQVQEPLQVRIGVATGLVVVGDLVGSGEAQERGVVGETPNLAARLQALAEPGTVVIAGSTRRLTGGLFDYRDLGTVALKGFAETLPAWQVLGASAAESRFEALRATTTPLVGRDEEIDVLLRRWAQAKRGAGQVVLISGEPGIGKSRIAETILERLTNEPHIRLRYFCSPHHQDSALYPSIAQLERAAGFRREDAAEERLAKLEGVLGKATNNLSEAVPLLADWLSMPTGDRYPPVKLSPQKRKEKTLHAQLAQVEGLAAQQPVLMVWEDVHWSDPTTRESLDLLIDRVATLRVLVIITFRPEFAPPWVGRPHVSALTLNRLTARQRGEMIAYVTGGRTLPRDIADQIVDRTDGVPLFIEELTKSVIESGMAEAAAEGYAVAGAPAPLAIPATLHASLLARLDRLAPTREVAQIGAALGRSFSHELIAAVAHMPQQKLDEALEQLVGAELVFRRGTPPDAEYTFKHALVQDAAHGTLLHSHRRQIHGRIAATLEGQFPEMTASQPAVVAQHCAEAGLKEKAIGYWLNAGQQAVARSAMNEAVAALRKGLEQLALLPETTERLRQELEFRSSLGAALLAVKGHAAPETGRAYARARELWEQLGSPSDFLQVPYGQSRHYVFLGELDLAQHLDEDLLRLSRERNEPAGLVLGHYSSGHNLMLTGRFASSRTHLEEVLALYDSISVRPLILQAGDDPRINSQAVLGIVTFCLGYPEQALAHSNTAIAEARRLAHPPSLASSLAFGSTVLWLDGENAALDERAAQLVAVATEQGFPLWGVAGTIHRGWVTVQNGVVAEGISLLRRSLAAYRATGAMAWMPYLLALLGKACKIAGQIDESLGALEDALQIVDATGVRWLSAELNRLKGQVLLQQGHSEAAEDLYRKALSIAEEQGARLWELRAAVSLARLRCNQGCQREARDLLSPIYAWFAEGRDSLDLKKAKALLDELG
jgi:class 3 adenylate cyclase/predicted ATPase